MKYFTKKIYLLLFLIIALLVDHKTFGKENRVLYTKDNITNYFSGTKKQGHPPCAVRFFLLADVYMSK